MLFDSFGLTTALGCLDSSDFYKEHHRIIFDTMRFLAQSDENQGLVDLMMLRTKLVEAGKLDSIGGDSFLASLLSLAATSQNIRFYTDKLRSLSKKRKIMEVGMRIRQHLRDDATHEEILSEMDRQLTEILADKKESRLIHISEIVDAGFEQVEHVLNETGLLGMSSGFTGIDNMTKGFQDTDLIFIAARPGMGKTSLALNITTYAALVENKKVGIISMEMGKGQLFQRMLGQITETNMRTRSEVKAKFDDISATADRLRSSPIWLSETASLNVLDIRAMARQQQKTKGLDLLMIDYLQLISSTRALARESKNNQVAEITRTLKCLARELNIPVICLSQLNRKVEERKDKRPVMADLRDSGSIEQDADMVIFIYRAEYYGHKEPDDIGVAEIIVAKQRNGMTGVRHLGFKAETCNFYTRR